MTKEKKVGIFILLSFVFLIGLLSYLEKFNQIFSEQYDIKINIKNSSGLSINSKVKLLGLEIGYISGINLRNKKILLNLKIDKNIKIPKDSIVFIKKTNLLGGNFLDIYPGNSKETLSNNQYLTKIKLLSSISNTTDTANILFKNMNVLINEFRDIITTTEKKKIQNLIKNSDELIMSIQKFFKKNEQGASSIIDNTNKITHDLDKTVKIFNTKVIKILDKLDQSVDYINSISITFKKSLPIFITKLDNIQNDIQEIVGKNKEKISDLVLSVNSFFDKGTNVVTKVNNYIDSLDRSEVRLEAYASSYMNNNISFSKSNAKLYYSPVSNKSYIFSLTSGPDFSENNISTNGYIGPKKHQSSKYLLSLEYGYQVNNTVFRGGIIEGTGGIGFDYLFNKQSNLTFSNNLYDLNAVNDVRGNLANLTSTLKYKAFNFLKFYIGLNNVLNKNSRNISFGVGVDFIDKDLKSIFGAILTSTAK